MKRKTAFAELTIGAAIATLRGLADGCGRLGNVWRTQLNSQTPRVKREPYGTLATHSGKNKEGGGMKR